MKRSLIRWYLIALAVLVLDQVTKQLIVSSLGPFDSISVLPFFNIVYAENPGSAFGMFKSLGSTFFITVSLVASGALAFLIWKEEAYRLPYALLLGGAAGNLIDRVRLGYVIDFLDCHVGGLHWPAFNVADSALTIGIGILILALLRDGRKKDGPLHREHPAG
jgi:signal peptidase II